MRLYCVGSFSFTRTLPKALHIHKAAYGRYLQFLQCRPWVWTLADQPCNPKLSPWQSKIAGEESSMYKWFPRVSIIFCKHTCGKHGKIGNTINFDLLLNVSNLNPIWAYITTVQPPWFIYIYLTTIEKCNIVKNHHCTVFGYDKQS